MIDGKTISNAFFDPFSALIDATVDGISRNAAEFITTNKTILLFGDFLLLLFSASLFIASIPIGVAAFESPNRFEVIFKQIGCSAGSSFFIPLKSLQIMGDIIFEKNFVKPDFSAIFISPFHRQNVPNKVIQRSTAVLPLVIIPLESSVAVPRKKEAITEKIIIIAHM